MKIASSSIESIVSGSAAGAESRALTEAEARAPDAWLVEIDLCSDAARALHAYGTSALRLERRLERLSAAIGVPGQFFVTPTAVFGSYRLPGRVRAHTQLLRLEPGDVDLGRLVRVEALLDDVASGRVALDLAARKLAGILAEPVSGSALGCGLAAAAISAGAAVFFGGGPLEVGAAGGLGLAIGVAERSVGGGRAVRLLPPAMAALAAVVTLALAHTQPGLSVATAQLSSLIVLIPGLEFTLAIKEIATANLVSGAARLVHALGAFLMLGFGLALGTEVAIGAWGDLPSPVEPAGLPGWAVPVAFCVAALGFGGRFRARRRDLSWVWLACALGYGGGVLGGQLLGAPLGAFAGAAVVGLAANLHARASGRTPLVMMVPGLILLVPGSIGFRSFALLLEHDVISAVEAGFAMLLTATALTAGLLSANVLVPTDEDRGTDPEEG